jgi:hypothetical protein
MVLRSRFDKILTVLPLLGILSFANIFAGQETPLLRLQRSKAYLNLETNVLHAQGMSGITYGKSGDVSSYPNSLSCLTVHSDGKYVFEKRDEQTVGKPKVKTAEGTLGADDLQHLKTILNDDIPNNATIREIESVDAQIDHAGTTQRLTTIKERLKMGASEFGGATNGMDTYLDNAAPFQKTINPLMKWFDGLEKKSKSDFKDSKPQYCAPMNVG